MKRTDFQNTQAFIQNLVEVNREMEENQAQMTPVIQGLIEQTEALKKENEQLKSFLEQFAIENEQLKKEKEQKEIIMEENKQMKQEIIKIQSENDQKSSEIRSLQQKVYLVEQSNSCQMEDLKTQLQSKENIIGNLKEQYELLNNEVQMSRKQIALLVDELERQRNESNMKNIMQENLMKMNELNGLFDQFKNFFEGNGTIGNYQLCLQNQCRENQFPLGNGNQLQLDLEEKSNLSRTKIYDNTEINDNNDYYSSSTSSCGNQMEMVDEMKEDNNENQYQNEVVSVLNEEHKEPEMEIEMKQDIVEKSIVENAINQQNTMNSTVFNNNNNVNNNQNGMIQMIKSNEMKESKEFVDEFEKSKIVERTVIQQNTTIDKDHIHRKRTKRRDIFENEDISFINKNDETKQIRRNQLEKRTTMKKESKVHSNYSLQLNKPINILLSGISKESKQIIINKMNLKGMNPVESYNENVTHVVVSSKLTLTAFRALIEGKWVVNKNWILNGMKRDEIKYGLQTTNLFKNYHVFISEEFLTDPAANEIANVLFKYAHVVSEPNPLLADMCLIGKNEIVKGRKVFTKDTFLKSLPLPKSVLYSASIPTKVMLMKTPVNN